MIIKYITAATNVDRVNTIHAAVFVVVAAGPGSWVAVKLLKLEPNGRGDRRNTKCPW